MPKSLLALSLLLSGIGTGISLGQENGVTGPADYGAAFERLVALGLPDTGEATYAKIQLGGAAARLGYGDHLFRPLPDFYELQLEGHGWVLEENEGEGTFRVLIGAGGIETFATRAGDHGLTVATWDEIDPAGDATKVADFLEKNEQARSSLGYSGPELSGRVLIVASQFALAGEADAGNRIVEATLSSVENPEAAVTGAISRIAENEYGAVLRKLFETRDWESYAEDTAALADKFGRGWKASPGAREMAVMVRNRPESAPVPEALEGLELDDRDFQVAEALAALDEPGGIGLLAGLPGPWILMEPEDFVELRGGREVNFPAPVQEILDRGIEAVPLLIALAADDWLLPWDRGVLEGNGVGLESMGDTGISPGLMARLMNSGNFGGGEDNSTELQSRPVTRGEVAAAILRPLLPPETQAQVGEDRRGLAGAARVWYERNRGKTRLELAKGYLRESGFEGAAGQAAFAILVEEGDSRHFEDIERQLLGRELDPWGGGFEWIERYLQKRGEEGGEFFAKFEEKAKRDFEASKDRYGDEDMAKQLEKQWKTRLAQLKSYVTNLSIDERLEAVLAGDQEAETIQPAILAGLKGEAPGETVAAVVGAAAKTESPRLRAQLLFLLDLQGRSGGSGPGGENLPEPLDLTADSDSWNELLRDTREPAEEDAEEEWTGRSRSLPPVHRTAAWIVEALSEPARYSEMQQTWYRFGDRGAALLIERARARMNGTVADELPHYPRLADDEELAKGAEQLATAGDDDAQARTVFEGLSLDVLGTAFGMVEGVGSEEKPDGTKGALIDRARKLQFSIESVDAGESWSVEAEELKGGFFDDDTWEKLVAVAVERAAGGQAFEIRLARASGFGGFAISLRDRPPEEMNEEASIQMAREQVGELASRNLVAASIGRGGEGWFSAFWIADGDADRGSEGESEETDDEAAADPFAAAGGMGVSADDLKAGQEQFRQALEQWRQPSAGLAYDLEIRLVGLPGVSPDADDGTGDSETEPDPFAN